MTNDKISEISEGGIALGENKFKEGQLLDNAIRAGECVRITATGIDLYSLMNGPFSGIMKEHEEFDLDTDIDAAEYGDVISEGYCAVMIKDPAATKYPGTFLYGDTTPGRMGWTVTMSAEPIAVLERKVVSGDDVAIVKLLR